MAVDFTVLLDVNDLDGRHQGAMGVLPHPFHTPMRLEKLWVAMDSLASASSTHFAAVAQGLRLIPSQNGHHLHTPPGAQGQVKQLERVM